VARPRHTAAGAGAASAGRAPVAGHATRNNAGAGAKRTAISRATGSAPAARVTPG